MTDVASALTRTVARQYDLFQTSLELLQKDRKFLNYGYTVSGTETFEARQQRLCLEVFQEAEIGKDDVLRSAELWDITGQRARRVGLVGPRQKSHAVARIANMVHRPLARPGDAESHRRAARPLASHAGWGCGGIQGEGTRTTTLRSPRARCGSSSTP